MTLTMTMARLLPRAVSTQAALLLPRLARCRVASCATAAAARSTPVATMMTLAAARPRVSPLLAASQKRLMFIQTRDTPNPNSLMFYPGTDVTGGSTADFVRGGDVSRSPLARTLMRIDGVQGVFLGPDFITISKDDDSDWGVLKPHIFGSIMDFFGSNQPVLLEEHEAHAQSADEEDDEVVAMIKELLDTRIRPAVQDDGGDITFMEFTNGIVKLKLSGACEGCPSSLYTLKQGVENMLMHYIPEVDGVEQVDESELDQLSNDVFRKFEESISQESGPQKSDDSGGK